MINEKTRFEIEYLKMKKRFEDYEEEKKLKIMNNLNHLKFLLSQYATFRMWIIWSWLQISLRQNRYSTHLYSLMRKIQISKIDCLSWEISWKKMRIEFSSKQARKSMYESKSMKMRWSIYSLVSRKTRSSHF
jgi:hypothetical protein